MVTFLSNATLKVMKAESVLGGCPMEDERGAAGSLRFRSLSRHPRPTFSSETMFFIM